MERAAGRWRPVRPSDPHAPPGHLLLDVAAPSLGRPSSSPVGEDHAPDGRFASTGGEPGRHPPVWTREGHQYPEPPQRTGPRSRERGLERGVGPGGAASPGPWVLPELASARGRPGEAVAQTARSAGGPGGRVGNDRAPTAAPPHRTAGRGADPGTEAGPQPPSGKGCGEWPPGRGGSASVPSAQPRRGMRAGTAGDPHPAQAPTGSSPGRTGTQRLCDQPGPRCRGSPLCDSHVPPSRAAAVGPLVRGPEPDSPPPTGSTRCSPRPGHG